MQKLYTKCLETINIEKAIRTVFSHEGAKTAGADGISKSSKISQEIIIKEVKLRLRRYKSVQSRKVQIPKDNGEYRELTIINLFNRIAQQVVYQIISPLLEVQMSKHSYGFRKGIGAKIPVSRLADILLRTIKHLMWTSKEYTGVGLSQGTMLGPLLANCYLTKLDNFIEQNFETNKHDTAYAENHKRHKDDWIEWNLQRGKKICCRYYRYADDTFITCNNEAEQKYIADVISSFIDTNLEIEINQVKSHYRHNQIHFLGFKIIKNKRSIWIFIDNLKEYTSRLRQFKLNTYNQCHAFMKWFRGILNYFDIVNDMGEFLDTVSLQLYRRNKRGVITKVDNVYEYGEGKEKTIIDIYALRKTTRTSYKEYIIGSKWLDTRELLKYRDSDKAIHGAFQYLWSLWTKQKGKDAITKENLAPFDAQIHHIIPVSKGGSNYLDNLVLVSSKTHYLIHHGKDLDRRFEKYRKHLR